VIISDAPSDHRLALERSRWSWRPTRPNLGQIRDRARETVRGSRRSPTWWPWYHLLVVRPPLWVRRFSRSPKRKGHPRSPPDTVYRSTRMQFKPISNVRANGDSDRRQPRYATDSRNYMF